MMPPSEFARYRQRLWRILGGFVLCVLVFVLGMAVAERHGLSRAWVGAAFLVASIILYTAIGVYCRTADPDEYYVAGRRVPALFNGMATAADWMSAASFISLAGGLYLQGFGGGDGQPGGLVYVLGWTGGFCLVALLVAPYLRRCNIYTLPDFFRLRYASPWPRRIAAMAAVLVSFTYVVAQIYGVGLITSRLTGVRFEIGILLGLSGVLACSFLGGMRAVTWTQVAQYVIILLAFLVPVSWLAYKQLGNPMAPLVYGQHLETINTRERALMVDPREAEVIAVYRAQADEYREKLANVPQALARDRAVATERLRKLKEERADTATIFWAGRELANIPRDEQLARERWTRAMQESLDRAKPLGGMPPMTKVFAGNPDGTAAERATYENSRRNVLALMFCLMVGTMGLPHLLTRFFTTPSVAETRSSVAWSLLFIAVLYVSAPALAVLVKVEVLTQLVGQPFDALPAWLAQWSRLDPGLVSVQDVNRDGILQFAELRLGADIVMLATPELGGLPYVVSGLVAAGGLAAALSTADGLLLTIGNAIARDLYQREWAQTSSQGRLVILSKFVLLTSALAATYVAAQKPGEILFLVAAAFSLAAAAFVPAMVLGIFTRSINSAGAIAGMLSGLGVTIYYMMSHWPGLRGSLNSSTGSELWFGIQPISAGVFGVPCGFLVAWIISWLTTDRNAHAAS